MNSYPVIIISKDANWNEAIGRLYEPFEESDLSLYSILHIMEKSNAPHGQDGYYILFTMATREARKSGLLLIDAQGDRYGYELPSHQQPFTSLSTAIQQVEIDEGSTKNGETIDSTEEARS